MKYTYIFAALFFLLASCKVGPDFHKPEAHLPDKWISADKEAKAAIEQEWWKHFHDSTLDELITKALNDNLDLKIATARIAEARARHALAKDDLLPTVNIDAGAERQANRIAFGGSGPIDLTKPFNIFQTGFDASWELDLFGGKRRALESASAELKANEAMRDSAKVSLLAEVARNYVAIRKYQAELGVAQERIAADRKTLDLAKERYHFGVAPKLDVTQAEALLASSEAQAPMLQSMLTQSEYSLDVLLAEQPGYTHAKLAAPQSVPVGDNALVLATPASVIANRPDIRAAEAKLASATAQQGVATAAMFPDISLSGFFGLLSTDTSTLLQGASKSWDVGGNLVWTILNYGKISANIHAANAREQEASLEYKKAILTALADVETALTSYTKQNEQRDFLVHTAEEDLHATDIARMRYKAGTSSFLEVLDAERTYYTAQNQAIEANAALSDNLIALYKSLGGGWKVP